MMMMHRSFLVVAAVVVGFMVMMGESIQPNEFTRYTSVTGFFEQDDPNTVAGTFDYVIICLCPFSHRRKLLIWGQRQIITLV